MEESFDFTLEPGRKIKRIEYEPKQPVISVIMPFYNDKQYIDQSVASVLNQTFPYYEIIIVDDGSQDKESLEKLEEIAKLDNRIKIFHKQNEGLAATRDYGANKANKNTKYLMFLDSDDLIESTFLECAYWSLQTNEKAGWTYADSIGFDAQQYTWNNWFSSEKLKRVNDLVSAALVRKTAFEEVNGYELKEKAVNEDWNFWLKLIAKGYYPVHISYYGQWYRRKQTGELKKARENKKRSIQIIKQTAKKITKEVQAIQYPKPDCNYEKIPEKLENILVPKHIDTNRKTNILITVPTLDIKIEKQFDLNLIKEIDTEKYNITIITTIPNKNILRQQFEQYATIYDLTSFIDQKYWLSFINYIIEKENINILFNLDREYGNSIIPYIKATNPNITITNTLDSNTSINISNTSNISSRSDISNISSVSDINTTIELISTNLEKNNLEYKTKCEEYEINVYGTAYSKTGLNYRKELLKEKLWKYKLWRLIVKMSK